MSANKILFKGGTILSMDPEIGELTKGDILVEGNKISAVCEEISANDCEVIDASGSILMPGFIDTHKHVWQSVLRGLLSDRHMENYGLMVRTIYPACFAPEDAYISNYAGGLEAINAGVTTVVDHSHMQTSPEHTDALIQGSLDSGIGGFFCYGLFNNAGFTPGGPIDVDAIRARVTGQAEEWHFENAARAKKRFFSEPGGQLRFGIATSEIMGAKSVDDIAKELSAAQQLDPELITAHIMAYAPVETLAGRPPGNPWIREMDERGLLTDNMIFSHLNFLTDEEFEILARNGVSLSDTPEAELMSQFYHQALEPARRAGMRISLGSDVPVLNSGDMIQQTRAMLVHERSKALVPERTDLSSMAVGARVDADASSNIVECSDYLQVLTSGGAGAIGLGDVVGSLTPGKQADIVMMSTDAINMYPVYNPSGTVLLQSNTGDIDTVMVNGEIRKRHGKLVGVNMPEVREKLAASKARLQEQVAKVSPEELIPVWADSTLWKGQTDS